MIGGSGLFESTGELGLVLVIHGSISSVIVAALNTRHEVYCAVTGLSQDTEILIPAIIRIHGCTQHSTCGILNEAEIIVEEISYPVRSLLYGYGVPHLRKIVWATV